MPKNYWDNPPEVEEDYIPQEPIVDEEADFLYSVALSMGEELPPEEPEGFCEQPRTIQRGSCQAHARRRTTIRQRSVGNSPRIRR